MAKGDTHIGTKVDKTMGRPGSSAGSSKVIQGRTPQLPNGKGMKKGGGGYTHPKAGGKGY